MAYSAKQVARAKENLGRLLWGDALVMLDGTAYQIKNHRLFYENKGRWIESKMTIDEFIERLCAQPVEAEGPASDSPSFYPLAEVIRAQERLERLMNGESVEIACTAYAISDHGKELYYLYEGDWVLSSMAVDEFLLKLRKE